MRLTCGTPSRQVFDKAKMSLKGKVVLVTGASRGIGAATVLELARHGARVVAGARNVEQLEKVRQDADDAEGEIAVTAMDVRREAEVKAAIALARDRFGGLDALVNNAAVGALGEQRDRLAAAEEGANDVGVEDRPPFLRVLTFDPAERAGTIINISSAAAADGFPYLAAYSASKAAIAALSMALRRELREQKIRVSTLRIHYVASEFLSAMPAERIGEATGVWMREGLLAAVPLMQPARVAETIRFLIELPPEASVHDVDLRASGA